MPWYRALLLFVRPEFSLTNATLVGLFNLTQKEGDRWGIMTKSEMFIRLLNKCEMRIQNALILFIIIILKEI